MVYDFGNSGNADKINTTIGPVHLCEGVVADTGSFRYASAHAGVLHTMVADLKLRGLEHGIVHENLF